MLVRKLACGSASGILSRAVTAPVDRIRLLQMTSSTKMSIASAYSTAISHSNGLAALWIGNGISCIKIAPEMALKLYAFDAIKSRLSQNPHNVSMMERFAAGGCAGALAEFSVYPLDVLRTRMATGRYASVPACFRAIQGDGGIRAFYAGLTPSIVGILPYAALDLCVYSMLTESLQ